MLGEYLIKKSTDVQMSIFTTQRDEQYWSDPLEFKPERWAFDFVPVEGSYAPFGG